jgi:hypothetical protein
MASRALNDIADAEHIQWLGTAVPEATLEPDLPICDAHHHLWIDVPMGQRRYLMEEIMQDVGR